MTHPGQVDREEARCGEEQWDEHGWAHLVFIDDDVEHDDDDDDRDEQDRRDLPAQRYSEAVGCSSPMPADREETLVHEPGDEDGARDQAQEVAEGPEEQQLDGAHRAGRVGRAGGADPA